jgi:hypothetical protein
VSFAVGGGRLRVADWGRSTCDLESTPRGHNPGELSAGTIFFGVSFVCVATVCFSSNFFNGMTVSFLQF